MSSIVLLKEDNDALVLLNELDALTDPVEVHAGDTVMLNHGLFVYVHGEVKQEALFLSVKA